MRALFKIGSFADRVPASIQAESELRLRARNSTPALISTLPPNPTTPLLTKCLHYFLKSSPANSVSLLLTPIDRSKAANSVNRSRADVTVYGCWSCCPLCHQRWRKRHDAV